MNKLNIRYYSSDVNCGISCCEAAASTSKSDLHTKSSILALSSLTSQHFTLQSRKLNIKAFDLDEKQKNVKLTNQDKLFNCYDIIKNIIETNTHNKDLQLKIEKLLFEYEGMYTDNTSQYLKINYSKETYIWYIDKKNIILQYLNKMIEENQVFSNIQNINFNQTVTKHSIELVKVLGCEYVSNTLISYFIYLVSIEHNEKALIEIDCLTYLGNRLVKMYIFNLYDKYKKAHKKANKDVKYSYSLSKWKEDNTHLFKDFEQSTISVSIAGNLTQFLSVEGVNFIERGIEYGEDEKMHHIYNIPFEARNKIKSYTTLITLPTNLPMIVKPKPYEFISGELKLGGYLNNDNYYVNKLFIPKVGYRDETTLMADNYISHLINGVNKVPYKINKNTLNYIELYGVKKNIIIDSNREDIINFKENPIAKRKKTEINRLKSLTSSIYLQNNIINIAQTYISVKQLYFPVILDQTTRLYCSPEYFNYQSSDLAKSLISFSEPGIIYKDDIKAIEYFKSYGAILFSGDLGKKSLVYRVKWLDSKMDWILNFRTNDIIDNAESKACFVSFCFEYERFINFMGDINLCAFKTYLPIQLDASCNGYQHISLLTREDKVFKLLNLDKSSKDNKPEDFYNYILLEVRDYIKNKLKINKFENDFVKDSYIRLNKVFLNRTMIKKAVMTYSYNTTHPVMVNYIQELLNPIEIENGIKLSGKINYKTVYLVDENNTQNYLTIEDINHFVKSFITVIKIVFPKMNELKNYTKDIVKICTKLKIPLPWVLPSGAVISQSYLTPKTLKLRPFTFLKSQYSFKTYTEEFFFKKQSNAAMPNLIHSLDASSIALLYKTFSKESMNLYTIHDCFAVTADKVDYLINMLKGVYIKIYSDEIYIITLHKHIINTIKNTLGNDVFTPDIKSIIIDNKTIPYPSIDKVINRKISLTKLNESCNILI